MKRIALLALILALVGCTSRTEFGECVGIDDSERKPELVYKLSKWNLFLGALFIQTLVVPIVVAAEQTYCPVAKQEGAK